MLLIARLFMACSLSAAMSSSSSESSKKPPTLLAALLFGTSLSGLRSASDRFLFFGDVRIGNELAGYVTGEERSVMTGGDEGIPLSVVKRGRGAFLRCFSGVSGRISSVSAQLDRWQYRLGGLPHS
jgi:hypothetical protein